MNFSEFKRWLNSDPASQDPEYQAARRSTPEFMEAAAASDEFERKLQRATYIAAPAGLVDNLKALAASSPKAHHLSRPRWHYALAASLLLAVSALFVHQQLAPRFDSVEDYVVYHYEHDGYHFLDLAGDPENPAPDAGELSRMLASVDLQMRPQLSEQVVLVKFCPTPEGEGIHLVMNTDQGLVTVIIMPGQEVQDGELFAFDGLEASLVSLPGRTAAAAIIGHPEQLNPSLNLALQDAVLPLNAGA
ncbi:MAG TPA: DUF3379 family protein [Xanthomonadales bacterium]|nr:DUF3379 family protein [Xanthomonadales bacterium]